jgi:hypothetical protein
VSQTYQGGERIEWNGAPDSKTPASVTEIAAESGGGGDAGTYLGGAALLVALLALGLTLRRGTA